MAITVATVTVPTGEIDPKTVFPDLTSEQYGARLSVYVVDAVSRAPSSEEAQAAWVYHRAFRARYLQMSSLPGRVDLEEGGSYSYTAAQINAFRDAALYWYQQHVEIVSAAALITRTRSMTTDNVFIP